MGKINVVINDDLDERFRLAIFKTRGWKKGNLTEAIEEAMELWINKQKGKKKLLKTEVHPNLP